MPPLQKQVVGVNLTGGLDTKSDERLVIPGKLLTAQNLTLSATGALTRRDGRSTLNSALSSISGLATFNNELLAVQGRTLYSLASGNETLYSRGTISPFTLAKQQIHRTTGYKRDIDCATSGTYTCYVWLDYAANQTTVNGIYATILDEATSAVVMAATQLSGSATAYCPRAVWAPKTTGASDADSFIIGWADAGQIQALAIPTSSFTPSGTGVFVANNTAGTAIEMVADSGNALFVYADTDATNSVVLVQLKYAAGTVSTPVALVVGLQATVANGLISGLAIAPFSAGRKLGVFVWVGGGGGTSGLWSSIVTSGNGTLTLSSALTKQDAGASPPLGQSRVTATVAGANLIAFYDQSSSWGGGSPVGVRTLRTITITPANAIAVAASTLFNSIFSDQGNPNGPFIAGKAFTSSGVAYLPLLVGGALSTKSNLQNTWFLVDSSGSVVAKALSGTLGAWGDAAGLTVPTMNTPPSSPLVGSTIIAPVGEKGIVSFSTVAGNTVTTSAVGLSRLVLTPLAGPPVRAQLGGNLFFAGAMLAAYDGVAATEAGFHLFPEVLTIADGAAGVVDAGVHQYAAVYEWVDGQGQRHQSAPSIAASYTAPGAKKATITIPTLPLSAKTNVNIALFRTKAAGTVFYRLNGPASTINNSTSAATVSYTDNTADSALGTGELLYTTGGILPANGPPACSCLVVHQNRLFIGGLEDPNEVRFSQVSVNRSGLQWNETLTGRTDPTRGAMMALASQDDKLLIWCALKPFVVFGTGPNGAGLANGYGAPIELPSAVGCSEPRSVLRIPTGVLFKAPSGWHLLGRDLTVKYVGEGAEAFNANAVTAAVMLDDRKEARFYGSGGTTLVYSHLVDQWTTFTGQAAVDAVWYPLLSAVVWATAAGIIYKDTSGAFADGSAAIVTSFDTGWLKPGDALHRYERVYRLLMTGPYSTAGALTISAFYDYSDQPMGAVNVPDTSVLTNPGPIHETVPFFGGFLFSSPNANVWQLRWKLPVQKCEAVRFRVTETPAGGSLAGLGFSSMSLELGVKKGAAKFPAAQSA